MTKINIATDMNAETANAVFAWGLAVADIIVTDGDRKLRLGDLTPAGVHYLADYGMAKSLADSVSGIKKMVKEAAELALADKPDSKPWFKFAKEAGDESILPADAATIEYVTNAVIAARTGKRFESIVASALAVRDGSGKRSAEQVWVDNMATAEIKAKHEVAKREMPKGAELATLRGKYVAAHADRFARAYADHLANVAAGAGIADDVLGF